MLVKEGSEEEGRVPTLSRERTIPSILQYKSEDQLGSVLLCLQFGICNA